MRWETTTTRHRPPHSCRDSVGGFAPAPGDEGVIVLVREPGNRVLTGILAASFVVALTDCASRKPPDQTKRAPEEVVSLAMAPSFREVPVIGTVRATASQTEKDLAVTVEATGSPGASGESWIEDAGGKAIARAPLQWDPTQETYSGAFHLSSAEIVPGSYVAKVRLRKGEAETEPVAADQAITVSPWSSGGRDSEVLRSILREIDVKVFFDTSSYIVAGRYDDDLQRIARNVAAGTSIVNRVLVQGHCDRRGETDYNFKLGLNRAETVATFLRGIATDTRIDVESLAEMNPDPEGDRPEDWEMNRWARIRVELK